MSYQIRVNNDEGKQFDLNHPYPTLEEAKNALPGLKAMYPNNRVIINDVLQIEWTELNIYQRASEAPYTCDMSNSLYSE